MVDTVATLWAAVMAHSLDWRTFCALVSAVVSSFTLITVVIAIYTATRPGIRRRTLRNPGMAYFVIPSQRHHHCDFAHQDSGEHLVQKIVVPSDRKVTVDMIIKPVLNFNTVEVSFGCNHESTVPTKPYAFEYYNRFIELGKRRNVLPGVGEYDDYFDKHQYYHVVQNWQWSAGMVKALGFKIKTNDPGNYHMEFYLFGDAVLGKIPRKKVVLDIAVSDHPVEIMRCCDPKHLGKPCALNGIRPRGSPS
jgi:hypothetical protein